MSQFTAKPRARKGNVFPPANASAGPPDVLTLAEAAAFLRTSADEVRRLMKEQGLPGRQVGDDYRFLKSAVQDWLRCIPVVQGKQTFWQTHFGALRGDPHLEEMLGEIYHQRGRPEHES